MGNKADGTADDLRRTHTRPVTTGGPPASQSCSGASPGAWGSENAPGGKSQPLLQTGPGHAGPSGSGPGAGPHTGGAGCSGPGGPDEPDKPEAAPGGLRAVVSPTGCESFLRSTQVERPESPPSTDAEAAASKLLVKDTRDVDGKMVRIGDMMGTTSAVFFTRRGFQQPKKMVPDDFEFLTVVGRGAFGKVVMARKKDTREIFAIKILRKDALTRRNLIQHTRAERRILEDVIDHPFLISLYYAFQTPSRLYFVLEFANGGELFHHLQQQGRFHLDVARFFVAELALVLNFLHRHEIIYRDLKPENVLLDSEGHLKVTDFGLSKHLPQSTESEDSGRTYTYCGTPEYLAPEILSQSPNGYSFGVDWWSLGTLMYEMVYGRPPFYDKDQSRMFRMILSAPLVFPTDVGVTPEAVSLMTGLLERDPARRMSGAQVLAHPFFTGVNWALLFKRRYQSPFRPDVQSATDTSYISSEFTRQQMGDTQPTIAQDMALFEGFTFVKKPRQQPRKAHQSESATAPKAC